MTRDEHTTNRPTPGGSAFQETAMTDHLTRVAEAVRDACAAEAFMETTLAVEYVSVACPGEIISNMILNNIDLPAVIASVPRPEPVAWRHSHTHSLHDLAADVELADGDEWAEPLYAEPVAAQPAEPDRRAAACMAAMDHISTETLESFNRIGIKFDATRGYAEELEAEIATLREQNAALVAALEGVLRWIDHWAQTGPGMDFERVEAAADAALACVKGGAV